MNNEAIHVEVAFLKKQIDEIKDEIRELRKENQKILEFVHQAQGGKRYLSILISLAVGIGALVDQLIMYMHV